MLATIVNFDALWKIAAVGFGVGAGAVAVWSVLLIAVSHVTAARDRDDTIAVVGYGTLIAGCGLLFAATLVLGFIAMTHK